MKKTLFFVMVALLATSCEKVTLDDAESEQQEVPAKNGKKFTFTVKGDFDNPTFVMGTRATTYLTAEENVMTDLWVFDFVGDECVQSIHQEAGDDDFGQPSMNLSLGSHHVYFVASRGDEPTLDETAKTITWSKTKDTFWKDYEVTVVTTSNGNRAVTLDRVVTKLKVTVNDEVPSGTASISVTPSEWYYGLNYTTGEPVGLLEDVERSVSVPANYIGTSGMLSMSVYGFSSSTEWTTDVVVNVKNAGGDVLGSAIIADAPLKRNRSTEYSGALFSVPHAFTIAVNDSWLDSSVGTW